MKAAFLDFDSLGPADIDTSGLTATLPGIALYPWTAAEDLAERIADRQVLLINKVRLDRESLRAAPALRLVCLAATGTDNVDIQAAREMGVAVCNIRNYCTPSVVQHGFGLLLALTLRLPEYRALVTGGAWQHSRQFCLLDYPVRELSGRRFGIVGYGHLGRAMAGVARAFGMEVVASQPLGNGGPAERGGDVERLPLAELLRTADVVSLHCPLTPATHQLINAQTLTLMRSDALLLNTARGGLVDGEALVAALRQGRLGGAGIDVLPEEPPVAGDPLLEASLPNLIVTPHVAWAARESRQRALDEVVANVRDFLAGGRRNRMD